MTGRRDQFTLDDLQRLLDAHGADSARWPAELRGDVEALCVSDEKAAALLHDAQALETLLDEAPALVPAPELKAKILAAAMGADNVVAFNAPAHGNTSAGHAPRTRWLAGLMAASLMIGVWLGQSDLAGPLTEALLGGTETAAVSDETFADILVLASPPEQNGDLL